MPRDVWLLVEPVGQEPREMGLQHRARGGGGRQEGASRCGLPVTCAFVRADGAQAARVPTPGCGEVKQALSSSVPTVGEGNHEGDVTAHRSGDGREFPSIQDPFPLFSF